MNEFSEIVEVELSHGICAVNFRGADCDSQLRSDLLVAVSERNEPDDFALARGQLAERWVWINMFERRSEKSSENDTRQLPA